MNIVIASGKGGTGKTLIATNLAYMLNKMGRNVTYLDCDVEEPDGHLFLKPSISKDREITIISPDGVDPERCISCGKCVEACSYNAIAMVKDEVLFFPELCHVCGACTIVCPTEAIIERNKKIGELKKGFSDGIKVIYATLQTGEGGMSPRLIKAVKEETSEGINILDSPPGTACPAVESIAGADLAVLVTDPTPFGINDLKLSVDMCRQVGLEPVIIVNRAEYRDDSLKEYCRSEDLEIIGEIPDDRKIAESYSRGEMVIDSLKEYHNLFEDLARKVEEISVEKREVKRPMKRQKDVEKIKSSELRQKPIYKSSKKRKELVIISGKGGTGKTSVMASFAALANQPVLADCDVDAADLHLITDPVVKESGLFSGGYEASINKEKCTSCGRCYEECRFNAIHKEETDGVENYKIDPLECEGCGVCDIVCPESAIILKEAINGEWFISKTRFGDMSHAKLGIAEENTGRLVTLVRENAETLGSKKSDVTLIDGAPGTGCPVIASLTGSHYAIVVTEPTVSGLHDMERVLDVIDYFGIDAGIIINKSDLNQDMTKRIKELAKERILEILGEIPYDNVFTESQMERKTVIEYSDNETSKAIKNIWNEIKEKILT
ncbi:MAG: P-loop NTPase [Thermoplasmatota archaeon]